MMGMLWIIGNVMDDGKCYGQRGMLWIMVNVMDNGFVNWGTDMDQKVIRWIIIGL